MKTYNYPSFIFFQTSIKQEEGESAAIANVDQVGEDSVTNPPEPMDTEEPRNSMKRKSNDEIDTADLFKDILKKPNAKKAKNDNFSAFGEAVATELKDVKTEASVFDMKNKILELIYETRIHILCAAQLLGNTGERKENMCYFPEF